jgi:8-oxo-dGTP pyrophosphatase MutT (NUDIX family)
MEKPIFKNKENEFVELKDGRWVHLSRSPSICVPILAQTSDGSLYALISQRGSGTPNYQYHYNMVCGYLDYDEDFYEAVKRELWEEAGLNAEAIPKEDILYSIEQLPWAIKSTPNGAQNVTHRYGFFFKVDTKEDLPNLSIDYCEPNEVIESIWVTHEEAMLISDNKNNELNPEKERVWAFNHHEVYREWFDKVTGIISRVKGYKI